MIDSSIIASSNDTATSVGETNLTATSNNDTTTMTTFLFLDRLNQRLLEYTTPHNIELVRESCIFNIISHGAMGFLFGGALGLFLSGMSSSTISTPESQMVTASGTVNSTLTARQQARLIFRDMTSRTWRSAKSFGLIGALFTGFECSIESYRARHDVGNTLVAGCLTGGVLGAKTGPKSALLGCVGFAAFSTAIEHFLQDRSGSEEGD